MRDYYEILGLQKTASESEIKKAYRSMAKKYHPDTNPDNADAEEKFKEVNQANDVLSDPEKRKLYDRFGHNWEEASKSGFGGAAFSGREMFNEFRREQEALRKKGENVVVKIALTLEECYSGCTKEVPFNTRKVCGSCRGTKAKGGTAYHTCTTCGGTGKMAIVQQVGAFTTQHIVTCNSCKGATVIIDEHCSDCRGSGVESETETAILTFPRGVQNGQSIMEERKGHHSRFSDGERGDAIFVIEEIPHERFERFDKDLIYRHKVDFEDLALGAKIEVPTIHGKVTKLVINPGTQNGKIYRFKGHGMPQLNLAKVFTIAGAPEGAFGNFMVELELVVKEEYSEEERAIIKQLRDLKSKNLDEVK
jgi:molecular chaperone DnaJ